MAELAVSCVLPVYNHSKFLELTLQSIFFQSKKFDEVVAVDDCSTDDSFEVLQNLKKKYGSKLKVLRNNHNQGSVITIDRGIKEAKNDCLFLCNSDDLFHPDRLFHISQKLAGIKAKLYWGFTRAVSLNNEKIIDHTFSRYHYIWDRIEANQIEPALAILDQNLAISTGNLFFSKALYERVGGFDEALRHVHDWKFVIQAAAVTDPILTTLPLYIYRYHSDNTYKKLADNTPAEIRQIVALVKDLIFDATRDNKNFPSVFSKFRFSDHDLTLLSIIRNELRDNRNLSPGDSNKTRHHEQTFLYSDFFGI